VGATKTLKCRATIIASSNRLLKKAAEQGSFRKDLYYRLNIFPICLKPLRSEDRREEITTLAKYFIQQSDICPHKKGKIKGMTKMAEEALTQYDWHGNIRELKNVIERAVMLENTEKIGLSSLSLNNDQPIQSTGKKTPVDKLKDFSLEKAEHELIARALQETGWQKTRAAALLGITRATLYTKVKQYNIKKEKTSTVNIPDAKKTVLA
jgi:DNA-binding NtrC family response regulator